ncbi:protein E2 [Equid gammaherpesvirus 2]|nr:protein E2 [Equid gammaherpesvirus 2]UTM05172.1 protein E2 [Equid gammaherpesvirus 2]
MLILGLVLVSLLASTASAIQAWMPEVINGHEGKPLEVRCHYAGKNPSKPMDMKLLKTIAGSAFMGTTVPRFKGPVYTASSCSSGTGVFTVDSLHKADGGRYACMVFQENDPEDESVCTDYHTTYTEVVVIPARRRRSLLVPQPSTTAEPLSTRPTQTTGSLSTPGSGFSVRAVRKSVKVYVGSSLHVECQFSGATAGINISAVLFKEIGEGAYQAVDTLTTSSLTYLDLSPVIEGTGQAKWCGVNASLEDSGNYMCMIGMDFPEGEEGSGDVDFSGVDFLKITVVTEPGADADEDDYLYTSSGEDEKK